MNESLTEEIVRELRSAVRAGSTIAQAAAALGVSPTAARRAVRGVSWAHVTDPPPVPAGPRPGEGRLTAEAVATARRECLRVPLPALAADRGVSVATLWQAVHGKTWAHVTDPPPVAPGTLSAQPVRPTRHGSRRGPQPVRRDVVDRVVALRGDPRAPARTWKQIGAELGMSADRAAWLYRRARAGA